jgi:hypothetical protein
MYLVSMDTYTQTSQTSLRLLFEIGMFHKSLPIRLMVTLVRTCRWFHEQAQPLIRKRELTLCRLRRPFRRLPSNANGYTQLVLPTSELEEEMGSIIVIDRSAPRPAPGDHPGISFTLTNIWLRANRRLECVIIIHGNSLTPRNEVTRTIRSDDYLTIGPNEYAVNLNLTQDPRWAPIPDYAYLRTGFAIYAYPRVPPNAPQITLYDFSHVILFFRTQSS